MLALKDVATNDLKEVEPPVDQVPGSIPIAQHVDLPVAASDDLSTCSVCQTSFFFGYEEDKLSQREEIYGDLAKAVRGVISHGRIHHTHSPPSDSDSPNGKASTSSTPGTCSFTSHSAADGSQSDTAQCNWRYGSGIAVPESVSNVCFGTIPQTMDRFTLLEDITDHIVDKDSARRLYQQYDSKTKMLKQVRRSDRMIDESMNRDDFDATPVLLHCGHTVCRGCAYMCVRAHENATHDTMFAMVDCPTRCNRHTAFVCDLGVEWLPIDIRRIRLLQEQKQKQQQQKPQAIMCSEHKHRVATVRCTHVMCAKFALMCAECDQVEHRARSNRDHIRIAPSLVPPTMADASCSLCSTHQQLLTGICVTDGTPVCGECLYDHIGHDVKRLHEVCSDWSKKLETLQRETLIRAHVLSDRAAIVQRSFDDMVSNITTHCDSVVQGVNVRRNELLFEARRWRKMQLEEPKMLAAESSKLSATAMYERMLLQRALAPRDDCKSAVKKEKPTKTRPARRKSSRLASAQSSSAAAAAAATSSSTSTSSSDSVATLASSVPDAVLGSIASTAHASGSAIKARSVELGNGIDAMRAENMSVVFHNATHDYVLDRIRCMGEVTVCPINIWPQGLAKLQSLGDTSSPCSRNSTKRKVASTSHHQHKSESDGLAASSDSAASPSSGPSHKRRRRDRQVESESAT
jgi:B-box zinc finger